MILSLPEKTETQTQKIECKIIPIECKTKLCPAIITLAILNTHK